MDGRHFGGMMFGQRSRAGCAGRRSQFERRSRMGRSESSDQNLDVAVPRHTSPVFGYDVADYLDVDPIFGNFAELDGLVGDAHRRCIRVLLDWGPNHSSDRHPWFVDARSARESPKRDWYIWHDGGGPDKPPNNWR